MTSRKPKGIVDDIYKGVTNIVSPWLGTPPGELKQVTQFKEATRVAAETLDQNIAGGMVKAGTQGNKALVKQAGVNAAALATGYVAGKAIQTAAGAVAKTAVVQQKYNAQLENLIKQKSNLAQSTNNPVTGFASAKDLMGLRSYEAVTVYNKNLRNSLLGKFVKTQRIDKNEILQQSKLGWSKKPIWSDETPLYESIKNQGVQKPIQVEVNRGRGVLLDGHHRLISQNKINPNAQVPFVVKPVNLDYVKRLKQKYNKR